MPRDDAVGIARGLGSAVDTPCDRAAHPLIIDGSDKAESLNADALGALTITDM